MNAAAASMPAEADSLVAGLAATPATVMVSVTGSAPAVVSTGVPVATTVPAESAVTV